MVMALELNQAQNHQYQPGFGWSAHTCGPHRKYSNMFQVGTRTAYVWTEQL